MPDVTRKSPRLLFVSLSVWAALVLFGSGKMVHYQETAGSLEPTAPQHLPVIAGVTRDPQRATLIMSLHPKCPCSRASLRELDELIARADDRLSVHILFIKPSGAPTDWLDGDLWNTASKMHGVEVSVDQDGHAAAVLSATTSGDVTLYDTAGNLLFKGGITDGRGHEGDNAGFDTVLSLIRGGKPKTRSTPVYGCALQSPTGTCRVVRDK